MSDEKIQRARSFSSLVTHHSSLFPLPARARRVRDVEVVEHAEDEVVDQLLDGLRPVVEARARGHYARARPREPEHVLKVYRVEGRLARDDDEPAPLLQCHVRGAVYEVRARARGYRAERPHRAGHDDHARLRVRARGGLRRHVVEALELYELRVRGQAHPLVDGARVARLYPRPHLDARDHERRAGHDEVHAPDRAARGHVQERAVRVDRAGGGPCDRCDLMYTAMPDHIDATDTAADWQEEGP